MSYPSTPQQPYMQYPQQQGIQQYPAVSPSPPRKKRRTWLIVLAIFLAILLTVGIIADRLAESFTEDQLTSAVESEMSSSDVTAENVSVEIDGFGFLSQLLFSEISEVTIDTGEAVRDTLQIEKSHTVIKKLEVPWGVVTGEIPKSINAEKITTTASVTLESLEKFVREKLPTVREIGLAVKDGDLHATIFGHSNTATVESISGKVKYNTHSGRMQLELDDETYSSRFENIATQGVPMPTLPFEFEIDSVSALDSDAVELSASASSTKLTL